MPKLLYIPGNVGPHSARTAVFWGALVATVPKVLYFPGFGSSWNQSYCVFPWILVPTTAFSRNLGPHRTKTTACVIVYFKSGLQNKSA